LELRGARLCERGGWCSGYDGCEGIEKQCLKILKKAKMKVQKHKKELIQDNKTCRTSV